MLRTILLGILAVLVVGIAFIASRPASFTVERSADIAAPPEAVFALLNDFHQWGRWSPWEKLDPNMRRMFDGPPSGPGAGYSWAGNGDVGEGRMKIVDAKPGESVTIDLEFLKPYPAKNRRRSRSRLRTAVPGALGDEGRERLRRQGHVAGDGHGRPRRQGLRGGLANLAAAAKSPP